MHHTYTANHLDQGRTRQATSAAQSSACGQAPQDLVAPLCIQDTFLLQEGRSLASAALRHLQSEACEACRVALIHNPAGSAGAVSLQGRAALAASRLQSRRPKIGAFLARLLRPGSGQLLL